MSYDLAVWEGERPSNDVEAFEIYQQVMDRMEAADEPAPAIRAYVAALLQRWPDITEEAGEDSPWADGPLINNAFGNAIYFAMSWSRAEEASSFAARLADEHGLVCYDPQAETLLPHLAPASPPVGGSRQKRRWLRGR